MKHGFIQGRLQQANPISLPDKVMEFLDKGNTLDTISGGCKRAFDMVSHEGLISDAEENEDYSRIKRGGRNQIKTRQKRSCVKGKSQAGRSCQSS